MSSLKRNRATVKASGPRQKHWPDVVKPGVGIRGGPRGMLEMRYASRVPELKFVDTANSALGSQSTAAPPTATTVLTCVQGAAAYQRIGQRVQLHSLRLVGSIFPNATMAGFSPGRVLVVYDRQANAAAPAWSDVIQCVTSGGSASSSVRDGLNLANRERFVILIDERMTFPCVTDTAGSFSSIGNLGSSEKNPGMFNFDRYVKLHGLESHFNNTNGGTIADIQTGSIVMFFVTDANAGTGWTFQWSSRIRYQDL